MKPGKASGKGICSDTGSQSERSGGKSFPQVNKTKSSKVPSKAKAK